MVEVEVTNGVAVIVVVDDIVVDVAVDVTNGVAWVVVVSGVVEVDISINGVVVDEDDVVDVSIGIVLVVVVDVGDGVDCVVDVE